MSSDEPPNSIGDAASAISVAGVGADDVDAEHPVGRRVGQDLHEAVGVAVDLGAAVGA